MDVTDLVDYNVALLDPTHLSTSFFHLSKNDPAIGFAFDASKIAGHTYPEQAIGPTGKHDSTVYAGPAQDVFWHHQLMQFPIRHTHKLPTFCKARFLDRLFRS